MSNIENIEKEIIKKWDLFSQKDRYRSKYTFKIKNISAGKDGK